MVRSANARRIGVASGLALLLLASFPFAAGLPVGVDIGVDPATGDSWSATAVCGAMDVQASGEGNSPSHKTVTVRVSYSFTDITGRTITDEDSSSGTGYASASLSHVSPVPAHPDNGVYANARVTINGFTVANKSCTWLPIG